MRNDRWVAGLLAASFSMIVGACDSPAPTASGTAASASAASPPKVEPSPAVASAAASPSAAPARVVKRKDPASCPKDGPVVFEDATLEAVVRRQLQKPAGPIARADLKKVKTLDLSQAPSNDALDPCIFMHLTGLKGLYLAPGDLDDLSPIKGATNLNSLRVSATPMVSPLKRSTEQLQRRWRR